MLRHIGLHVPLAGKEEFGRNGGNNFPARLQFRGIET